jgi:hypothetical protein
LRSLGAFRGGNPFCGDSEHEASKVQVAAIPEKRRDTLQRRNRVPSPCHRISSNVLEQVGTRLLTLGPWDGVRVAPLVRLQARGKQYNDELI